MTVPQKATELAALSTTLAELQAQYDVLMNAFKFEEARAVHARIEAVEEERRELAKELPPAPPEAAPAPYRVTSRRRRR